MQAFRGASLASSAIYTLLGADLLLQLWRDAGRWGVGAHASCVGACVPLSHCLVVLCTA